MKRRPALAVLRSLAVASCVAVVAAVAPSGCYGATEIDVAVTTTVPCTMPSPLTTQLFTGAIGTSDFGTAPAAVTDSCGVSDQLVGTLSIVPSGARDGQFDLAVVGAVGVPVESCRSIMLGGAAPAASGRAKTTG